MREIERFLVLEVVDARWREHLESMEYLRDGIHLRAMAQKDPLVEYRSRGHLMFEELGEIIREEVVRLLFHVELQREGGQAGPAEPQGVPRRSPEHESLAGADAIAAARGNGGGGRRPRCPASPPAVARRGRDRSPPASARCPRIRRWGRNDPAGADLARSSRDVMGRSS